MWLGFHSLTFGLSCLISSRCRFGFFCDLWALDPDNSVVLFHREILLTGQSRKTNGLPEAVASGSPTDLVCSYSCSTQTVVSKLCAPVFRGVCLYQQVLLSVGNLGIDRVPQKLPAFGGPTSVTFKPKALALRLCVSVFRSDLPCTKGRV